MQSPFSVMAIVEGELMMEFLIIIVIGFAIAIPAILLLRYLATRYGEKRAAMAADAFRAIDPREPDHVQAWGNHAIGLYRGPDALVAMRPGISPHTVDPASVSGWYVGKVSKEVLSSEMADIMSSDDDPVAGRTAQSKWVLIYDADRDLLAQVGYMKTADGEAVIELLDTLLPNKRLAGPGKLPALV